MVVKSKIAVCVDLPCTLSCFCFEIEFFTVQKVHHSYEAAFFENFRKKADVIGRGLRSFNLKLMLFFGWLRLVPFNFAEKSFVSIDLLIRMLNGSAVSCLTLNYCNWQYVRLTRHLDFQTILAIPSLVTA